MTRELLSGPKRLLAVFCTGALLLAGCSSGITSDSTSTADVEETADSESSSTTVPADAGEACEEIAASFVTQGSANPDLEDPEVLGSCAGDTVVVTSNGIPDFPYIETSPGAPRAFAYEFEIPVTPVEAESPTAVPLLGSLGVAINGIPIFGPTEGGGGDVFALGGGFTECGGHNGPTGYHYHTFDATGSDECLFTEAEATTESVLFGYALDGYPIYSGNYQFTSSWELTDDSLFATDTWAAHTYVEGSGDLDECNGRTDEDGNYAYYTTDEFPYVLGCFVGEVDVAEQGGGGGGGGGQGAPPEGGREAPAEGAGE